ncbi:Arc family DNA-binding protein [Burkholderia cenocepacia]|uniref:Arc family DNA-binding protein n=1 Tax=Burkholderia cenocepacia TaxID=95486 RepID=UPI000F68AA24|nr:Arc family DNA-binding protein [Burkholderia cenocepacia]RSB84878.1 Arc family DNA-binding protein [Burkholderia cenocepacia]
MARTDPQVNIRMPQDLKERLEVAAAQANRSLNKEIIERLQQSLDAPTSGTADASTPVLLYQMLEVTEETEKLRKEVGEVLEIVKNAMTPDELKRRFGRGPQYDEPATQQAEVSKPVTKRVTRSKKSQP